jgi:LmbE family N-acetylglucosaminyl deacetylase
VTRTLVCFHAHPDDESMLTAGTMAKVAAGGDRVVLVVATRGERGEAAGVDDLGVARLEELERSAAALAVARVEVLGYGDSGSGPERPPAHSFVAVPIDESAERLAAILRDEAADVLTIYDPLGGYGHPDHVRVHDVGRAAAQLAGTPVVLEATISRDLLALAAQVVPTLGFDLPADVVPPDLSTVYTAAADITHTIDVSAYLAAKRASMEAHVSQTTGGTTVRTLAAFLALPGDLFAAAFGTEWFVDRGCPPGSVETDVFATLERTSR